MIDYNKGNTKRLNHSFIPMFRSTSLSVSSHYTPDSLIVSSFTILYRIIFVYIRINTDMYKKSIYLYTSTSICIKNSIIYTYNHFTPYIIHYNCFTHHIYILPPIYNGELHYVSVYDTSFPP
jgi:hypothetical protein